MPHSQNHNQPMAPRVRETRILREIRPGTVGKKKTTVKATSSLFRSEMIAKLEHAQSTSISGSNTKYTHNKSNKELVATDPPYWNRLQGSYHI